MLYGTIWACLPFADAEFTETSHEAQVVCCLAGEAVQFVDVFVNK